MAKIKLTGYILVPKEELEVIKEALEEHILLTQNEKGGMSFDVRQDDINTVKFWVDELFIDQQAFDNHQQRVKNSYWGKVTHNVKRVYKITEMA